LKAKRKHTLFRRSKQIAKHVDLDDPEEVKLCIAGKNCGGSCKEKLF